MKPETRLIETRKSLAVAVLCVRFHSVTIGRGNRNRSLFGTEAPMTRRWTLKPAQPELAYQLSTGLGVHPVVGHLLVHRGVATVEQGKRFLDRRLAGLHDPDQLGGASTAADLICRAIDARKVICIYGDYDVDGMCATAILMECLRLAGAAPRFYVPDRLEEGYGVNAEALKRLRDQGIDLILTVDCGVTSFAEAQIARSIGLEYIVTDHHEPASDWPCADAVVHPRLPGAGYPFHGLSGAGVAFKLAWQIARRSSGGRKTSEPFQQFLRNVVTLVAIGTICDVVPITDENRALVYHGLSGLRSEPSTGLARLLETARITSSSQLDADAVAFKLGPRLNACGRLGQGDLGARLGVELLITRDERRARELANYLEEMNRLRRSLERRVFQEARLMAEALYGITDGKPCPAIVLGKEDWHPGIIGIAASRMAETFHRPCILVSFREDYGTGSGRSVAGFDLVAALAGCRAHLLQSGGHAMAAGLRIRRAQFPAFRDQFHAIAADRLPPENAPATLEIDTEVPLHALTPALVKQLDVLEPYGPTNPQPVMLSTNLSVVGEPRCVGDGRHHLSFQVKQGDGMRRAIAFGQADRAAELVAHERKCSLVFHPKINEFRGFEQVDLQVIDFRPGDRFQCGMG
jgi:single-stranded-DNA-specific exonuclease